MSAITGEITGTEIARILSVPFHWSFIAPHSSGRPTALAAAGSVGEAPHRVNEGAKVIPGDHMADIGNAGGAAVAPSLASALTGAPSAPISAIRSW